MIGRADKEEPGIRLLFIAAGVDLFFDHMDLQIIEINGFDKAVLRKACLVMEFEVSDIGIQPDRLAKIKSRTDLFQRLKNHGRAGHGIVRTAGDGIF